MLPLFGRLVDISDCSKLPTSRRVSALSPGDRKGERRLLGERDGEGESAKAKGAGPRAAGLRGLGERGEGVTLKPLKVARGSRT